MAKRLARLAETLKWSALILVIVSGLGFAVSLPAGLDPNLKNAAFVVALAAGGFSVVVAVLALVVTTSAWIARRVPRA